MRDARARVQKILDEAQNAWTSSDDEQVEASALESQRLEREIKELKLLLEDKTKLLHDKEAQLAKLNAETEFVPTSPQYDPVDPQYLRQDA